MHNGIYKASSIVFSNQDVAVNKDNFPKTIFESIQNLSDDDLAEYLDNLPAEQKEAVVQEKSIVDAMLYNERRKLQQERMEFEGDRFKLIEISKEEARAEKEYILEQARAEAEKIVEQGRTDAEKLHSDMLNDFQNEIENIKATVYQDAFNSAKSEAIEHTKDTVQECLNDIQNFISLAEEKQKEFIANYERDMKWAVLQVSRKVLNRMVDEDELNMEDMIVGAVDVVRDADWIDVTISNESQRLLEKLREELSVMDNVTVNTTNMDTDSAVVATNKEILGVSVDKQIDNMIEYFKRVDD